jgi:hypothetical protein
MSQKSPGFWAFYSPDHQTRSGAVPTLNGEERGRFKPAKSIIHNKSLLARSEGTHTQAAKYKHLTTTPTFPLVAVFPGIGPDGPGRS